MTHNSRVRLITDPWASILPSELAALDANIAAGINGVDGSTHSPTSVITISGGGGCLQLTGPLTIARGGTLTLTSAGSTVLRGGYPARAASTTYALGAVVVPATPNGRRYLCTTPGKSGVSAPAWPTTYGTTVPDGDIEWSCLGPDGDVPQYAPGHAGRTPTVVHSLAGGRGIIPGTWRVRNVDGMVQAVAPMMDISDGNGPQVSRWVVPLRMHDTGTVVSVSVSFRVGWPHTALPTKMPGARLLRIPTSGIPQFLTSIAAGADPSGYVYLTKPSTAAAWTGQQTLTLTCDQNNLVDIADATYILELVEEQWPGGPQYPWSLVMKQPVDLATAVSVQGLGSGATQFIDGVEVLDGTRILIKDYPVDNANGIWVGASGPWTRAPDLAVPGDFTQGMIVPVTGTVPVPSTSVNGMSYWQAQTSKATWAGNASAATSDGIVFLARGPDDDETQLNAGTQFFAHGCIWGAASVTYSGIAQQDFS